MKTAQLGNLSLLTCAGCWIATEVCISSGYLGGGWSIIANAFEAGTVGGLADWFAVSALFREIPIPGVRRHTNIIVKNRDRITQSIAEMVQNRWLSPAVVREKLEKSRVILLAMEYVERDSESIKEYAVSLLRRLVEGLDDEEIVSFLEGVIKVRLYNIDLGQSLGKWMLDAIDRGYHNEIWTILFDSLERASQHAEIKEFVARKLWEAAGEEKEKGLLKKMFIGAGEITGGFDYYSAAETLVAQYQELLEEAKTDPDHLIRAKLDRIVVDFAHGMAEGRPEVAEPFNRFRESIVRDAELQHLLGNMMGELKASLLTQLDQKGSPFLQIVHKYVDALLTGLKSDPELQGKIDKAIKTAIITFIEKNHALIGDMVRASLDPGRLSDRQMVAEIEEKVGDDLQFIRLNGALVGWFIGLALGAVKVFL